MRCGAAALAVAVVLSALAASAFDRTVESRPAIALPPRAIAEPVPARLSTALERAFPGHWRLAWDPQARLLVAGVRGAVDGGPRADSVEVVRQAGDFLLRAELAPGAALERVRAARVGAAWHVTYQQRSGGEPVFGASLDLVLTQAAQVVAFRSSLAPGIVVGPASMPPAALVGVAAQRLARAVRLRSATRGAALVVEADGLRAVPAVRLDLESGQAERWDALVDAASGALLALDSRLCELALDGTASATVQPLYAKDVAVERPLPWLHVGVGEAPDPAAVSDAAGRFTIEPAPAAGTRVHAELAGNYIRVTNEAGDPPPSYAAATNASGRIDVHFGDAQARLDERTIYVHANIVHDFTSVRFGFHDLDYQIPAVAATRNPGTGDADYANAYWDGEGLHFGNGGGLFYNFGLFADVIYHEYVHAVTQAMYRPFGRVGGIYWGAIQEALSDYFACTITNDAEIGEHLDRSAARPHLRTLENNLRWPEDATYEAHGDGQIFGGALWDLRRLVGPSVADPLVHLARSHGPLSFDAYLDAILLEDDLQFGDAQALNGSPHRDAILTAFGNHGWGPSGSSARALRHVPLRDTEDPGIARRVIAAFDGGLSTPADTVTLFYGDARPYATATMRAAENGDFVGEIPGAILVNGVTVRYYIVLRGHGRVPDQSDPPGAPDSTYAFHVGPDTQPPTIAHVPITSAAALAWPARAVATVDDNLGVANAWIELWRNGDAAGAVGMLRSAANPARFEALFPNIGGLGDVFEYRIHAVDGSRGRLESVFPAAGRARFEIVAQLRDGYESGPSAWQHATLLAGRSDPWHWSFVFNHTPDGGHGMWCGSEAGEYPPGVASALESELYPVGGGARARIWSRIDAEPNGPVEAFDAGVVEIQLDGGGDWLPLAPVGGYTHRVASGAHQYLQAGRACLSGRDVDWRLLEFDLGAYARHRVRLRFLFASDLVATPFGLRGWALDDFELDPGTQDPTDVVLGPGPVRLLVRAPAPNPFNPQVEFALAVPPACGPWRLCVFDARGRMLRRLATGPVQAGPRRVVWDGTDEGGLALPSGVYYYRLESRFGAEQGSIVLVR